MSDEKLYMQTSESVLELIGTMPSIGRTAVPRTSADNAKVYNVSGSDCEPVQQPNCPEPASGSEAKKTNASLQVKNHMAIRLAFIFSITIFCGLVPLLLNAVLDESIYYPCSFMLIAVFLTMAGMALYSIFSDSEKVLRGIERYNTDSTYRFSSDTTPSEKKGSIPSSLCDLQHQLDSFFNAVELANLREMEIRENTNNPQDQQETTSRRDQYVKELITNLSHEIRTPLSNLKLTAECLEDGVYDFNDDNMHKVSAEITKIDRTFTAIKSYSVASASIDKTETCNAMDLIESAFERARTIAGFTCDERGFVECRLSDGREVLCEKLEGALVSAPAIPMTSVFDYVIDNAFKHADGMTTLEFDASLKKGSVVFYVRDNGCGTDADRDTLCAPFWKADASHTSTGCADDEISLGLGLSMADDIVSACDGSLGITSSAGSGMQVEIELPLAKA